MIYRKKPIKVKAFQLGCSFAKVPQWAITDSIRYFNLEKELKNGEDLIVTSASIDTLEGTMQANQYDWIIQGIQGELYSCKQDIFLQTYQLAEVNVSFDKPPSLYHKSVGDERDELKQRNDRLNSLYAALERELDYIQSVELSAIFQMNVVMEHHLSAPEWALGDRQSIFEKSNPLVRATYSDVDEKHIFIRDIDAFLDKIKTLENSIDALLKNFKLNAGKTEDEIEVFIYNTIERHSLREPEKLKLLCYRVLKEDMSHLDINQKTHIVDKFSRLRKKAAGMVYVASSIRSRLLINRRLMDRLITTVL